MNEFCSVRSQMTLSVRVKNDMYECISFFFFLYIMFWYPADRVLACLVRACLIKFAQNQIGTNQFELKTSS